MSEVFARNAWYPVAAENELPLRHVYHAQLMGHEFAIWRADDGNVNVWENRCLHRGVRLSIGINMGKQLKCQYHGWRYANGSGACTYIPAHPADAPARTIRNRTYPSISFGGHIWTTLAPDGSWPPVPDLDKSSETVLRAMPVNAAPEDVVAAILQSDSAQPGVSGNVIHVGDALLIVQPVDANRCVIRGLLNETLSAAARTTALRATNERLSRLRDAVEATAVRRPDLGVELAPPPEAEGSEPRASLGRRPALRVRIARKWMEATDVAAFALAPVSGGLPAFDAGAHIDVHLPNGLVRQYSLTNGPQERDEYVIAVKRDAASSGGSAALHDDLMMDDLLAISAPRNNFPLAQGAAHSLLIAGGIGVTPLIAMSKSLSQQNVDFALHHFARSRDHVAFTSSLADAGVEPHQHLGLTPAETETRLQGLLAERPKHGHLYACGPAPMLDAIRRIADGMGWPEDAVHVEHFGNPTLRSASSTFTIDLARSALSLEVPQGRTIVEVLRENGVAIDTSCEQGACGTCLTTVLSGIPDHQDVFLSKTERDSGTCMMPCVSRATSARLTLDL